MKLFLRIVWLLDVLNVPGMGFLDTTIPINGLLWLLIWIFVIGDD
jgi:hypothetical protein